jgi:hypothetical protein
MTGQCQACQKHKGLDRAHFKTRGSGAGWEEHEWTTLCRACHTMQGQIGWKLFTDRFPRLLPILEAKGWVFVNTFGIWKLRRGKNDSL